METANHLAHLTERPLVVTHGNGPQVGNLLLRSDLAAGVLPRLPLDTCVADTQGGMGFMLQQCLDDAFRQAGVAPRSTVTVVTRTVVDADDPAFRSPSKPIGNFYDEAEARRRMDVDGWHEGDAGRGWRRWSLAGAEGDREQPQIEPCWTPARWWSRPAGRSRVSAADGSWPGRGGCHKDLPRPARATWGRSCWSSPGRARRRRLRRPPSATCTSWRGRAGRHRPTASSPRQHAAKVRRASGSWTGGGRHHHPGAVGEALAARSHAGDSLSPPVGPCVVPARRARRSRSCRH